MAMMPWLMLRRSVLPSPGARMVFVSALAATSSLMLLAPALSAQAPGGFTATGRVVETGTSDGISLATVELEGHGATLTDADGGFRFDGVEEGGYELRVVAFGYAPATRFVVVEEDLSLEVPLEVAPVALDSLVVAPRTLDLEGEVRDPAADAPVVDAEVLTNQGRAARTDSHGRFRLSAVPEGVPLLIHVRAFGYLPVDSTVVPEQEDEEYRFELVEDPVVRAMIDVQVERLEERAAPRFSSFRNLNRDRLMRYAGSATLRDVLEFEYGTRIRGRIRCVVVDEEQLPAMVDGPTLATMLPEEVERMEVIFGGSMLRIYTRDFMREMIARDMELRTPSIFQPPGPANVPPLCR